ncbi:MAG: hypothetical protein U0324_32650 [Polyangiales bacterium]
MRAPLPLAFALASLSLGCMTSSEPTPGESTFACPSGGSLTCTYNSQYCLLTVQGGTTTPSCATVPPACSGAGSPCSCITATLSGGSTSCASFSANNLRATTVTLNR